MEKLIANNLFGNGLVAINQPNLVERYNECLKDIGLKQTLLKSFHIDKWGWSPEIANEQQNQDYLCFGIANPFGIILTPQQKSASIYHPFHSFDWDLMDAIFNMYKQQIKDVTTQSGLWFELNQEISTYRSPQDLLLLDALSIKFYTPGKIIQTARDQKKLVQEFYDKPSAWADTELHQKILDSATQYGDLRNRNFEIAPLPYTKATSFYARAFGGLFVFKNTQKHLLIFEDNSSSMSGELTHNHVEYNLNDEGLVEYLKVNNLIRNDVNFFKTDVFSINILMDTLLLDLVTKHYPEDEFDLSSDRHKNKYIHLLSTNNLLPEDFFSLEEIVNKLKRNATLKTTDYSKNIQLAISYPNPKLAKAEKIMIWSLICKFSPLKDVLQQYLFDKNQFFADYKTWPEQKQDWAIKLIKEHKHHMFNYKITKE